MKRCTRGKSCGATCIAQDKRCVLELGPVVSMSVAKVRDKVGVVKLYHQVRAHGVRGFQNKFNKIRGELRKEIGQNVHKTIHVEELQKRLKEAGLLPKSASSKKPFDPADLFVKKPAEPAKREAINLDKVIGKSPEKPAPAPSLTPSLKKALADLGPPRQLDRSPGAPRTRTAPAIRDELQGIAKAAKKGSMTLMMDDISRLMRGSIPENLQIVSAKDELGMKARFKTSGGSSGSATGNTRWARQDAGDFDKTFKIYKRIRGDKDMIDWNETVKNGQKIGEGSFGTVLKVGNMAHKRGEVGADEANIIKRVGQADIGPKLHGAEITTKRRDGYGVDLHNGRIAMSLVPGRELGDRESKPNDKIAGKNVADIYWKAMADLHRLGIAHNDAHPHNILVDNNGKGRWVDMGLAQASPKAALAEALGVFNTLRGAEATRISGAAGQGNWQSRSWDATGVKNAQKARDAGGETWKNFMKNFPVAARVWENKPDVLYKLQKMGLTQNDLSTIIDHGIRSPMETYTKGPWAKLTDAQAQEALNTLYDGI